MPVRKAKHRINRGCKAQVIQLCLAKAKPLKHVRMLREDKVGVHDAVGAGVGKRVQQNGVDEGEHRGGSADAEREGEHGDGGEARVAEEGAKAVTNISAELIEEAEADGVTIDFVLGAGLAQIDAGFAPGFFFGEALAD